MALVLLSLRGDTFLAYGVLDPMKWIPDDVPIPAPGEAILIMSSSMWWNPLLKVFRFYEAKEPNASALFPGDRPYLVIHHAQPGRIQIKPSLHAAPMIAVGEDEFRRIMGAPEA